MIKLRFNMKREEKKEKDDSQQQNLQKTLNYAESQLAVAKARAFAIGGKRS